MTDALRATLTPLARSLLNALQLRGSATWRVSEMTDATDARRYRIPRLLDELAAAGAINHRLLSDDRYVIALR